MNGESVPEAWDEDVSNNIAALSINARPFVPNVQAAAFIPSFLKKSAEPEPVAPITPEPVVQPESVPVKNDLNKVDTELTDQNPQDTQPKDTAQCDDWEHKAEEPKKESKNISEESKKAPAIKQTVNSKKAEKAAATPEPEIEKKDHLNVVFIGHVDAGKSTIGGQIMYLTGMVDKRTLEKYEREAKEKNRETWYLSWVVDTNQEERDKGKTVEVGRAYFETENKHFTILDAPGHRSFVPNMIGGASQADVAVLVISARRGEFETGFERGGQTREHAMLAKTAGVKHLVVLINKMDDSTVGWNIKRYEECKEKLTPFLKRIGFNPKTDIHYMPCSGLTGKYCVHVCALSISLASPCIGCVHTLQMPERSLRCQNRLGDITGSCKVSMHP